MNNFVFEKVNNSVSKYTVTSGKLKGLVFVKISRDFYYDIRCFGLEIDTFSELNGEYFNTNLICSRMRKHGITVEQLWEIKEEQDRIDRELGLEDDEPEEETIPEDAEKEHLSWKVHTPNLLNDIVANMSRKSYEQNVMTPMLIFQKLLVELAELAIEIDDPRLSLMMCRLTLFSCADPSEPDYDKEIFSKLKKEIVERG